jgi:hypothetical protein
VGILREQAWLDDAPAMVGHFKMGILQGLGVSERYKF